MIHKFLEMTDLGVETVAEGIGPEGEWSWVRRDIGAGFCPGLPARQPGQSSPQADGPGLARRAGILPGQSPSMTRMDSLLLGRDQTATPPHRASRPQHDQAHARRRTGEPDPQVVPNG